jgi:hypothetical protein
MTKCQFVVRILLGMFIGFGKGVLSFSTGGSEPGFSGLFFEPGFSGLFFEPGFSGLKD